MDRWHDYWELCGCEPLEREKPYSMPLDSRHISVLLYMQWAKARGIRGESPLDDYGEELVRVVREPKELEEPLVYAKLLESLSEPVRPIRIKLWSSWERMAVAKWARIEEYLALKKRLNVEKARLGRKRKHIYAKRVKLIKEGKGHHPGEEYKSVEELEARALEAERAKDKLHEQRAIRFWNQANIRRKEIEMANRKQGLQIVEEKALAAVESGTVERPEVELEVIRVGPNPRIVVCRYKILAEELIVKLRVKSVQNFTRGMRIRMREQEGESWEFHGILPRRKGAW